MTPGTVKLCATVGGTTARSAASESRKRTVIGAAPAPVIESGTLTKRRVWKTVAHVSQPCAPSMRSESGGGANVIVPTLPLGLTRELWTRAVGAVGAEKGAVLQSWTARPTAASLQSSPRMGATADALSDALSKMQE